MDVHIRPVRETDYNFIYSTMLKGLYWGCPFYGLIPQQIFFKAYQPVLRQLFFKPGTEISIACLPDEPDCILGFAAVDRSVDCVHYCFTKSAWRHKGIAKKLLTSDRNWLSVSHVTKVGDSLRRRFGLEFNPFLI